MISPETLPSRLGAVMEAMYSEFVQPDTHPWIVAYSGGKDSTLLLQMAWEVAATAAHRRSIIVIANDTLVESPLVIRHLHRSLSMIAAAARKAELPITVKVTEPCVDQTFWVNVIGRGYIPPTRNFRWCTDRMKIAPTNAVIETLTRNHQRATLLIGTRRSESQNRRRAMDRRGVAPTATNPHDTIENCRMFAPLADLADDDVWKILMQRKPPWGGSHRNLITLYRNAGGGDCPLVLSKEDAPSCGTTSPRFGCWTCTVVKKDRSLRGIIESGHPDENSFEAMADFREWLIALREDPRNRLAVRRDGRCKLREDGSPVLGPFTLAVRQKILDRLQLLEVQVGETLILPAELEVIDDVWRRDRVREAGRQALLATVGLQTRALPA